MKSERKVSCSSLSSRSLLLYEMAKRRADRGKESLEAEAGLSEKQEGRTDGKDAGASSQDRIGGSVD